MQCSPGSCFGLESVGFAHTASGGLACQWKGFPE